LERLGGSGGFGFVRLGGLWTTAHQPLLASYEVAEDTLGEPVSQGKGTANQNLSLMGVLCREGEPVKNPGVCAALLLPPTHLVKRQKNRDKETLCTHPPYTCKVPTIVCVVISTVSAITRECVSR